MQKVSTGLPQPSDIMTKPLRLFAYQDYQLAFSIMLYIINLQGSNPRRPYISIQGQGPPKHNFKLLVSVFCNLPSLPVKFPGNSHPGHGTKCSFVSLRF